MPSGVSSPWQHDLTLLITWDHMPSGVSSPWQHDLTLLITWDHMPSGVSSPWQHDLTLLIAWDHMPSGVTCTIWKLCTKYCSCIRDHVLDTKQARYSCSSTITLGFCQLVPLFGVCSVHTICGTPVVMWCPTINKVRSHCKTSLHYRLKWHKLERERVEHQIS